MPRGVTVSWCNKKQSFYTAFGAIALVVVLVVASSFAFGTRRTKASANVQQISVIFRHGARTPTEVYPKDPYNDPKHWPDGMGALTKTGKQQLHRLGQFLRARYDGFLSARYSPDDVYVFSSDSDRCLMSAQLCLSGLYPPVGDQVWNSDIAWQPIPVHTVPRKMDKMITMKKACPRYSKEFNDTYAGDYFQKVNQENAELYKYLTEHTGKTVDDVLDVEGLYNTLDTEQKLNLPLPDWTKNHMDKMRELESLGLASFTFTPVSKRLYSGPLVGDVVRHMSDKILGLLKPNRRAYLYSAHDITLISFLRTLGYDKIEKPGYGAALILELHVDEKEGDHFVEMWLLKNADEINPVKMSIPGCEDLCKLKDFIQLTKPFVPEDWEAECLLP